MRLLSFTVLIITLFLFSSCGEIVDIIDDPDGKNTITATINGEEFKISGLLVTATYTEQDMVKTLGFGGAKLPLDGVTNTIALAVVTSDSVGINSGDVFSATTLTKAATGQYSIDGDGVKIRALSTNTDVATITISEIDFDQKLVSGTFSFDAVDNDDPDTVYEVRDGVFTDVSFE